MTQICDALQGAYAFCQIFGRIHLPRDAVQPVYLFTIFKLQIILQDQADDDFALILFLLATVTLQQLNCLFEAFCLLVMHMKDDAGLCLADSALYVKGGQELLNRVL